MGVIDWPGGKQLNTIERPFIPDSEAGSKPFKSCVPDGVYELRPVESPRFGKTWALVNPALRVWQYAHARIGPGRYAILFHAANWAAQLQGCIAPGFAREFMSYKGRMSLAVTNSQRAMALIRDGLERQETHRLFIRCTKGAALW